MPKVVQVGDHVVEFPDELSNEEVAAAIRKSQLSPVHPLAALGQQVTDFLGGTESRGGVRGAVVPSDFKLSDIVTGPAHAIAHPIESGKLMLESARDAAQGQFEKMFSAAREGKPVEAAARGVAGALPFVGPGAAEAGDLIKEGHEEQNPHKVAAGLGLAAGLIFPFLRRGKAATPEAAPKPEAAAAPEAAPVPAAPAGVEFHHGFAEDPDTHAFIQQAHDQGHTVKSRVIRSDPDYVEVAAGKDPKAVDAAFAGAEPGKMVAPVAVEPPATTPAPAPVQPEPLPTVPLTRGEETGSRVQGMAERSVESSFPGAPIFDRFRQQQQKALIGGLADEVVKRISSFEGSPEELGMKAQSEISQAQAQMRGEAAAKYAAIDSQAGGVQVPTAQLKAFANQVRSELSAVSGKKGLLPAGEFTRTLAILDKIKKAPQAVDFTTMHAFRSNLLGKIRDLGVEIPDRAAGVIKKFSSIADASMDAAAPPALKAAVRDASTFWRDSTQTFNDSLISRMAEVDPEKVHTLLKGASLDDIRRVQKTLPASTYQAVKANLLSDIFQDSIKGGTSEALPGHGTTPTMKGPVLRSKLESRAGFGDDRLKAIFKPEELSNINKVLETAERITPSGRASSMGTFINLVNASLLYSTADAARELITTGSPLGLAKPAAIYAGTRLAAKLMTDPAGSSAMVRFARAIKDAGIKLDDRIPQNVKNPAVVFYANQVANSLMRQAGAKTREAEAANQ